MSLSLKSLTVVSFAALTLGGAVLTTTGPAHAQLRGGYSIDDDDDDFDRPRVQRRVIVDEDDDVRPRVRRQLVDDDDDEPRIQRRIVERRIIERRVSEPVVREIVERRPVVRRVVVQQPVIRPVVERRFVQPVVERRVVRVAAPVEECRTVVRRRTNAFGDAVVTRVRSCD